MPQNFPERKQKHCYEEAAFCRLHRKVIGGGMLGQFSVGYILGSIGISMSLATGALSLDAWWLGLIGAASLVGLMLGSLFMGPVADHIGRKRIFCTTMAVFTLASVLQFFVTDATELFVLRLILGLALGADYAVGLTIVSEWTPARLRPRALSFLMIMWVGGYVSAYVVGYCLQFIGGDAWRWILLTCAVPSAAAMIVRAGTPESPSWLIGKGRADEAQALVDRFIGPGYCLPPQALAAPSAEWSELFSTRWRKNTIVGGVFFACQVIPYFSLSIFLPQVFKQLGMEDPYTSGIIFNLFLFLGVLLGTWLIDRISRRLFLTGSFYLCAAALLTMTVWQGIPTLWALICISTFSFIISAASVLEFVYPPELFSTELRGSGVGFCVACSRIGGAGGTFLLPIVMENFGTVAALSGCVAALLLGGVVCQLWAPETGKKRAGQAAARA